MNETLENAAASGSPAPGKDDMHGDTYFFLKDSAYESPLTLSDILDCLKYAEAKGLVPPVPVPWWISTAGMYPGHESWTDIPGRGNR